MSGTEAPDASLSSAEELALIPEVLAIAKRLNRSQRGALINVHAGIAKVSIELAHRAASVIFHLTSAAADRAWQALKEGGKQAGVVVGVDTVELEISEGQDSHPHAPTSKEIYENSTYRRSTPEWDQAPSGRLKLSIRNGGYLGLRRNWAEGKRQRIPALIPKFIDGIENMAVAMTAQRIEREEQSRRWEEERKRAEERPSTMCGQPC